MATSIEGLALLLGTGGQENMVISAWNAVVRAGKPTWDGPGHAHGDLVIDLGCGDHDCHPHALQQGCQAAVSAQNRPERQQRRLPCAPPTLLLPPIASPVCQLRKHGSPASHGSLEQEGTAQNQTASDETDQVADTVVWDSWRVYASGISASRDMITAGSF